MILPTLVHLAKVLSYCLMLVSLSGEYMANGLTNAIRHQFAMIADAK